MNKYKPRDYALYLDDKFFKFLKVIKPLTYDGNISLDKIPLLNIGDFTWCTSTNNISSRHIEDNRHYKNFDSECFIEVTKEEYEKDIRDKVYRVKTKEELSTYTHESCFIGSMDQIYGRQLSDAETAMFLYQVKGSFQVGKWFIYRSDITDEPLPEVHQMYRIKTFEEFNYKRPVNWNTKRDMDYLYGMVLSIENSKEIEKSHPIYIHDNWRIEPSDCIKTFDGDPKVILLSPDELKAQWIADKQTKADELNFYADIADKPSNVNFEDYKGMYRVISRLEYLNNSSIHVKTNLTSIYSELLPAACNAKCRDNKSFEYKGIKLSNDYYKLVNEDEPDFDTVIDEPKSEYKIISRNKYMNDISINAIDGIFEIYDEVMPASYNKDCSMGIDIKYRDFVFSSSYYTRIDAGKAVIENKVENGSEKPRYRVLIRSEYIQNSIPPVDGLNYLLEETLDSRFNHRCDNKERFEYKGVQLTSKHYKLIDESELVVGTPGYGEVDTDTDSMEDIKFLKKDEGESDVVKPDNDVRFTFRQQKKNNVSIDDMDEIKF